VRADEVDKAALSDYLYHISVLEGSSEYALNEILLPGAYAKEPLLDRLHALRVPTVFMYGAHDWMDARAGQVRGSLHQALTHEMTLFCSTLHCIALHRVTRATLLLSLSLAPRTRSRPRD
jgi:hypothetical protein